MAKYSYQGEELNLFEEAKNWKRYFAEKVSPFIKGKVLEVGSGMGESTPYLINSGVLEWTCLEPDEKFISILEQKKAERKLPSMCRIEQGTLADLSSAERYDTILYIDVLEHIKDDQNEVELAITKLEPNGYLIIICPAFIGLYSSFDKAIGHYRRYNKTSLRKVVTSKQLTEIDVFFMEVSGMFLLFFNKYLFRKKYPSLWVIKIWDRMLVPVSKVLDRLTFYSLGKSIVGVWKNKTADQ